MALHPLLRNRIAIAQAKAKGGAAAAHDDALAGVAIWAKVSPEVDGKIREQIKAGVFPIRLKPEDWDSGEVSWLLDVIAPTRALATAVLGSFRQLVGEGRLFVHPLVRGAQRGGFRLLFGSHEVSPSHRAFYRKVQLPIL